MNRSRAGASAISSSPGAAKTGAGSWQVSGRWSRRSRTASKASSSDSTTMEMLPLSSCWRAPPSSAEVTFSPVTSRMTFGPVTYISDSPSTAMTKSVVTGAYTAPPAERPSMTEICGLRPESGSWRREISEYMARDVTASWIRAPPESWMPMTGQPTLMAISMTSTTLRPKVSPTEPP